MGMRLPKGYKLPPGAKVLGINVNRFAGGVPAFFPEPAPRGPDAGAYLVEIDGWHPPTLNSVMRGSIRTRIAAGKRCDHVIAAALAVAGVPAAEGKRRVALSLGFPPGNSFVDVDAPWKALLDALVKAGALIDDSYRWCELAPIHQHRTTARHTLITLTDIDATCGREGVACG